MTIFQTHQTEPMSEQPFYPAAVFDDKRNIVRGGGRVIYAPAVIDSSGKAHREGWVLPGGERTTNEFRARDVADAIHDYVSAAK